MSDSKEPFYIGYLPLPASLKATVVMFIAIGLLGAIAMAFVIAPQQQDPGPGKWDTATLFAIEGRLSLDPYPLVYVEDPESPFGSRAVILVSQLKFGAQEQASGFDGKQVRAEGNFISRNGHAVFELKAGEAIVDLGNEPTELQSEVLGEFGLVGEITDSKCFLGLMKPGFGKTHRACAVRCISGGIPPIFVTRDDAGEETIYLLTDTEHRAINEEVLPFVSEPVALQGRIERHGDILVYAIDPGQIERL